MRRPRPRSLSLGLLPLILGPIVVLGGCGESNSPGSATGQEPPKNQMEGLQRIQQANLKYDLTAPAKHRSRATPTKK